MNQPALQEDLSFRGRFSRGIYWNTASLAILGVSGILINVIIGRFQGPDALGVFNLTYAVYIFMSQIAVGGIHYSVLRYVSYSQDRPEQIRVILGTAIVVATITSLIIILLGWHAAPLIGTAFSSPDTGRAIPYVLAGLLFFSINKILLNLLNGLRLMKQFAIFQSLRYLLLLASVSCLIFASSPAWLIPVALTISELLLCAALTIYICRKVTIPSFQISKEWIGKHLSFGARGFLSGVFTELNTRIDVIMLGIFLSDAQVGIYSFAAMLAEGFSQLSIVVRKNVDPILGQAFSQKASEQIEMFAAKLKRVFFPIMLGTGLVAVICYPIGLTLFVGNPAFQAGTTVFAILMVGVVLNSLYRPLGGIVLQGDRPGINSLFIGALMIASVTLNYLLIPRIGIIGAAWATCAVYILEAILIRTISRKIFKIRV